MGESPADYIVDRKTKNRTNSRFYAMKKTPSKKKNIESLDNLYMAAISGEETGAVQDDSEAAPVMGQDNLANLAQDDDLAGEVVVASGEKPGGSATLSSPIFEIANDVEPGQYILSIKGRQLIGDELADLFAGNDFDAFTTSNFSVLAVQPGDLLAVVKKDEETPAGKNVFGLVVEEESLLPGAGNNITFNTQNGRYTANCFGYLYCDGKSLHIQPPVWLTPDAMSAYYVNLPQISDPVFPSPEQMIPLLALAGILERLVDYARLDKICRLLTQKKMPLMIKIAKGSPPIHGMNARFELAIDVEVKAGTLRQDGSMDMRERNVASSVKEGALLARKILATKGVTGMNLLEKKLPALNGQDISISTNIGVRRETKKDHFLYFAKKNGNFSFKKGILAVSELYSISGNVDYSVGNIDLQTNLTINGSVLPGFSVKAEGETIITGNVENGATIVVRDDLDVGQGIHGATTRVIVFGDLHTSFIQDAEVLVKGDVTVGTYLFNARLRAGGTIRVLRAPESSRGGSAVGGIVCASKGIELSVIGSPTNQSTVVALQPDPELQVKIRKIEQETATAGANISKMMRTLELDGTTPELIRELLSRVSPDRRKFYLDNLNNMSTLIKYQNELKEKLNGLKFQAEAGLQRVSIRVSKEVFRGNEIQIGDRKLIVPNDLGPTTFKLDGDHIIFD